jgi:indolepyruvate ferredoxin oxidoreductase alpha subunit
MKEKVLLGDEAVALGAIHAGLSTAYAYPGTPSTEITEFLIQYMQKNGGPHAAWCANEKTAFEEALGASLVGRRALVSMKHVGLNVAADPLMNSALLSIEGGLVIAVADDPGMHSSQNEQDSRFYADFAHLPCLEPANQQQAYDMTREAFELSEWYGTPVIVRLVTRLAHSRAVVRLYEPEPQKPVRKSTNRAGWILLPANARKQWKSLLDREDQLLERSENSLINHLDLNHENQTLGVITTGIARNYYYENLDDMNGRPSTLHIGMYPVPVEKIRKLAGHVKNLLILEEGYPYLERQIRGILPRSEGTPVIRGKMDGAVPATGELDPNNVREALGLPQPQTLDLQGLPVKVRPPQLCSGCPHCDSYHAIAKAMEGMEHTLVTADIGCYTLGALPPYSTIESCVCMGASIGMAKGASEAGHRPAVAVIGDGTFLHSGITPLVDAVAADTDMTLLILDNEATAMTGGQDPLIPSSRLAKIVEGIGVDSAHFHILPAHPKKVDELAQVLRTEFEYKGLSVVIAVRECIETVKRKKATAVVSTQGA